MIRKLVLLFALISLVLGSMGCLSSDHRHNRRHMWAIDRDIEMLHKTTDRHFFNYDWDDPYRN